MAVLEDELVSTPPARVQQKVRGVDGERTTVEVVVLTNMIEAAEDTHPGHRGVGHLDASLQLHDTLLGWIVARDPGSDRKKADHEIRIPAAKPVSEHRPRHAEVVLRSEGGEAPVAA